VEGLVRGGIESFVLIDNDTVNITNLNRQLIATTKTIDEYKVDVAKERILDINPNAKVEVHKTFYMPGMEEELLDDSITYIVDCIDTVTAKIDLVVQARELGVKIISCMGVGNKLEPTMLEVANISKTSVCPLAKAIRQELRKRGIDKLKVVYSKEEPTKPKYSVGPEEFGNPHKKQVPGSVSFVPSVAGMILAGEVIKDFIDL